MKSSMLVFALAATLSACTLEPEYQRPASPVPQQFSGDIAAGSAQSTVIAEDIGWREFFPDAQLQRVITLALANNRDLRVAALNVQAAQAQYRVQRADLLPTVSATASQQVQKYPAGVSVAAASGSSVILRSDSIGIGFTSYELDFFGRIRSLNHAALEQYFGYEETRRSAQLSLVAEVANAWLTLLADQTLLRITHDTLDSQSASLALMRKRYEGGASSLLDLRQAESTVDAARANVAAYTRQLALDRNALSLLLGIALPADLDTAQGLDTATPVAEMTPSLPSDVLMRRPDVLAAEHQLVAANADIGAARAAFFPRISLTGNYGTASSQLSGLFKDGSEAWTFSPTISLPIFAAGANVANLDAAKIARDTAVAQYEKAIQSAFREVADALAARATLDDQLAAQQALVDASSEAYRLADLRFRNGVDSYLSVLDAQRSQYSAQQQLQTLRLTRLQNLVTVYKTLGGGLREQSVATLAVAP